jgi:hypothetical protein
MRTTRTLAVLLLSMATFAACGPNTSRGDDDGNGNDAGGGGGGGAGGGGGGGGNGDGGTNINGCSTASQLVYVVDENYELSSFDPTTKTFTDVGSLESLCDDPGGMPFSMGVDRNANAYVLYDDHTLYQVTGISSGTLACTATSWASPQNMDLFGMGFSTTAAGGTTDQLYIAGGADDGTGSIDTTGNSSLDTVDVSAYTAQQVGTVKGTPELTGTSAAELWGFFPDATKPRIDNINKTSGAAISTYSLSAIKGDPEAWAFAAYGGDLWIFLMKDEEDSTTVYQIGGPMDAAPGTIKSTTPTNGRVIVGAGVSTCAPTVLM